MVVKNVEKKEKNAITIVVEVDKAEFEAAVNRAFVKNRGRISVPGFRKGKAPRAIIEGMYGPEIFQSDAIDELCPKAYDFAIEDKELKLVGRPTVSDADITDEKTLVITFQSAVYPEVTLGQYRGLEAPKDDTEVPDSEVDEELERVRMRGARIETVERPAEDGDTVVMDFEGFLDSVPFDGGAGKDYSLVLGSGRFVPGFEQQLVGMSAGEERDIDITFPDDYNPELAGKSVVFHVKVNEVKETQLPELDDEFAKDMSEFDTLEEYKAEIRGNLEKARQETAAEDFKDELIRKAVENMECEIPDAMIEQQQDNLMRSYAQTIAAQGYGFEQYLSMIGVDYETFRASSASAATHQVQSNLLLNKIVEVEGIEVSEEEIEQEYAKVAESYKVELDHIKKNIPADEVKKDLQLRKAADIISETGVATEPVQQAETEAQAEAGDESE